jgi:diguanylate cyclase (GGDEF)-like protein
MRRAIREGRECRVTLLNFRKDGAPFWCEVHLAPVCDALGHVVQYVGVQNDVSDRVRAEMQLREERDRADYMARHDLLTGLPSRQEFNDRADGILAELPDTESAVVLFIDLDDFKRVNDRYGHETGDDVLRQSARELRRLCGRDVLLARQSGDEFVALFTSLDAQGAIDRAQELAAAISEQLLEHPVVGVVSDSELRSIRCWPAPTRRCTPTRDAGALRWQSSVSSRRPDVALARLVTGSPHVLDGVGLSAVPP